MTLARDVLKLMNQHTVDETAYTDQERQTLAHLEQTLRDLALKAKAVREQEKHVQGQIDDIRDKAKRRSK